MDLEYIKNVLLKAAKSKSQKIREMVKLIILLLLKILSRKKPPTVAKKPPTVGAVGPAWTYDKSVEKPAGKKDMGGWEARVYTKEQQARLGVDETGKPIKKKVEEKKPAVKKFPSHWGEPPRIQTRDLRELPGGYGFGSSTLANWINLNMKKDNEKKSGVKKFPSHWGKPPGIQTADFRELPGGYGFGSSTLANWINLNMKKDNNVMVYFYMKRCGYCNKFNPIWEEFVKKTEIKTKKVELGEMSPAEKRLGIKSVPTIMFLGSEISKIYVGPRNVEALQEAVKTGKNFASFPKEFVVVYFYLDGCPHCIKFTPEWEEFVKKTKLKTKKVEAKKMSLYERTLRISGFPTVMILGPNGPMTYKGGRKAEDLLKIEEFLK